MSEKIGAFRSRANDKHVIELAVSSGHRGKVKNVVWQVSDLEAKLSEPGRDTLTKAEFAKLPETEQVARKNRGYMVGGHFKGGLRKIENISGRWTIAFDADELTKSLHEELFDPIVSPLAKFEYLVHTTRSHTPEHPRARVIFPLAQFATNEEFEAASRILAQTFDPLLRAIDPVSHRPAQVMYWPTVAKDDKDFRFYRNRGVLLDVRRDILDPFPKDWTNHDDLPYGERDRKHQNLGRTKAEHPHLKKGVVGAYCRTRSIHDQLFKYPDLYSPSEEGPEPERFSYLKGHSRNGVLVFIKDQRTYSNHSSDPCYLQNLNAYDHERIVRFGDLDKNVTDDTPMSERPSVKAMNKAIAEEDQYADVRVEMSKSAYSSLEEMANDAEFDADLEDEETEHKAASGAIAVKAQKQADTQEVTSKDFDLFANLDQDSKGNIKPTFNNIRLIMTYDPRIKGAVRYNELSERVVVVRRIVAKSIGIKTPAIVSPNSGDPMHDALRSQVRCILSAPSKRKAGAHGWGIEVADDTLRKAIDTVAREKVFHPIRDYLESLTWDGVPRLRTVLNRYCHRPNDRYHREVSELLFTAAVARVYEPGHKYDYLVVLEGPGGLGKSTFIAIIAVRREWFGGFTADVSDTKKVVENLRGKWIVEWPELASMKRGDSERVKDLISGQVKTARLSYRADEEDYPMRSILVGSSNDKEYLKDQTGNRRFLPVEIDRMIDTVGLRRVIDQVWAEALVNYRGLRDEYLIDEYPSLPLFLSPDLEPIATAKQEQRRVKTDVDEFLPMVDGYLDEPVPEIFADGRHRGNSLLDMETGESSYAPDTKLAVPHRTCCRDIWVNCLGRREDQYDYHAARMIAELLRKTGKWEQASSARFEGFGVQKSWNRSPL